MNNRRIAEIVTAANGCYRSDLAGPACDPEHVEILRTSLARGEALSPEAAQHLLDPSGKPFAELSPADKVSLRIALSLVAVLARAPEASSAESDAQESLPLESAEESPAAQSALPETLQE